MSMGQLLAELGMDRAAEHAERMRQGWVASARAAVADYITRDLFVEPFTCEDVRDWAKLPEPPDRRAWGAVMMSVAKEGWIRKAGYRPHKAPSRHNGISTVWEKTL